MKLIIAGDEMGTEDLVVIARFFREFWKHRKDKLFIMVEHGTEHMTSEECQDLIKQVFMEEASTKTWSVGKITEESIKEFREKIREWKK